MINCVHSEVNMVLRSKLNNLLSNQILVCKIPDGYVSMHAKIVNGSKDIKVAKVSIEISMDNKPYPVSGGIISTQMALDMYGESVSEAGNDILVIDVVSKQEGHTMKDYKITVTGQTGSISYEVRKTRKGADSFAKRICNEAFYGEECTIEIIEV